MTDIPMDFEITEAAAGSDASGEQDPFSRDVAETAEGLEDDLESSEGRGEGKETDDPILEVNGHRAPLEEYAGGTFPAEDLSAEARDLAPEGVPIKENGCPDFSEWSKASVEIEMRGDHYHDYKAANRAAGFEGAGARAPIEGHTWHHCEDTKTMQLVPSSIHADAKHIGGVGVLKAEANGQVVRGMR